MSGSLQGEQVAVDHSAANYSPSGSTLEDHLAAIDAALGTVVGDGVGNYNAVVWNPAAVANTPFVKTTFEAAAAALLATPGFGIIYLHGWQKTGYNITSTSPIDLQRRIAVVCYGASDAASIDATPRDVVLTSPGGQIRDPWYIQGKGGRIGFSRATASDTLPCIEITASNLPGGDSSFWAEEMTLTSTASGFAPTLSMNCVGNEPRLTLENCRFENPRCIQFAGANPVLVLKGDSTDIQADDLVAEGLAGSTGSLTVEIQGSFLWSEPIVGASWSDAEVFTSSKKVFPKQSAMLSTLLNNGTTVWDAVKHDASLDKVLFNDVPLDATGGGDLFLANDGTYKSAGGDTSPAPANIYVDGSGGNDANDGSELNPVLTLAEARNRIGDRNGDTTIWLMPGSYSIAGDAADRIWSEPRKGWGRLTVRGTEATVGTPLTIIDTAYSSASGLMRFEVDSSPDGVVYPWAFVRLGSDDAFYVVRAIVGNFIYVDTGYNSGTPSPATIQSVGPSTSLSIQAPASLHCGNSHAVRSAGYSARSYLELFNLSIDNSGESICNGSLKVGNIITSGRFNDVIFDGSGGPVVFQASTYLGGCHTSSQLTGAFYFVNMYDCGGRGNYAIPDDANGMPFAFRGAIAYTRISRSYFYLSGSLVAAGDDYVRSVHDSRGTFELSALGLVYFPDVRRSSIDVAITECTDGVITDAGMGNIDLRESSRMNVAFADSSPYLSGLNVKLSGGSIFTGDRDFTSATFPGLDFSPSNSGYVLIDGSKVARSGANLDKLKFTARNGPYGGSGYVSQDPFGESSLILGVPDAGSDVAVLDVPDNRSFVLRALVDARDSTGTRYRVEYRIVGTSEAASVLAWSVEKVLFATDDDQTDDPSVGELGIVFTNPSGLTFLCTLTNNVGGGASVNATIFWALDYYLRTTGSF